MGKVKDQVLFKLIHEFFTTYLQEQRNCSVHTIRSYQKSLEDFLDFVKERKQIVFSDITFEMLNDSALSEYLTHLEEKSCSISTRNNRLKARPHNCHSQISIKIVLEKVEI